MIITYDGMPAWSGETFFNQLAVNHHVRVDHLTQLGEPASFRCRGGAAGAKITLHQPAGAQWVVDESITLADKYGPLKTDDDVEVFRSSVNLFQVYPKGKAPVTGAGSPPALAGHIVIAGQSMMTGIQDNPGPLLYKLPNHGVVGTAVGGSSLFPPDPSGYWLNTDHTAGPLLLDALAAMAGKTITHIVWAQGHDNRDELDNGTITKADYKAGVIAVLEALGWATDGTGVPVVIEMPGCIPAGYGDGWQKIREVYQELRDTYADVKAYEVYDLPTYDAIHKTPAAQKVATERAALLLSSSYVPPSVTVSRPHDRATVLTFSEPVGYTFFQGASPQPLHVAWNDDMDECVVIHEPGTFQYPAREGLGLAGISYGNSADGVHFPIGSF